MNPTMVASELLRKKESVILIYAFNATGKTRLPIAYKDASKREDGAHTGVYFNAHSEDLFVWDNDELLLEIRPSSLNRFHSSISEDDVRQKLARYRPNYCFRFITHQNPEHGIKAVRFFHERAVDEDPNNVQHIPIKISRGEERIFIWCFFLALFDVEDWTGKQSSHFFIDDPVSSLDDHNIFVTASTIIDLIEEHFRERKIIITTHHVGLFSILADWLKKGEKSERFKRHTGLYTLSARNGNFALESCNNDVFLYHLRLMQLLEQAHKNDEVKSFHFALLRQVLENVASFLGVGQFSYVLEQIGISDPDEVARILNTLSHKKVYYFESDELNSDNRTLFSKIFTNLKEKYRFVLHSPTVESDQMPTTASPATDTLISQSVTSFTSNLATTN